MLIIEIRLGDPPNYLNDIKRKRNCIDPSNSPITKVNQHLLSTEDTECVECKEI